MYETHGRAALLVRLRKTAKSVYTIRRFDRTFVSYKTRADKSGRAPTMAEQWWPAVVRLHHRRADTRTANGVYLKIIIVYLEKNNICLYLYITAVQ